MKNRTNTAAAEYARRQGDIARLIDVLQMELERHAEAAQADPRNWGWVGDLGEARGKLIQIVSFLSGHDRAAIEAFLAE